MRSSINYGTETPVTDLFPKQFLDDFTLYLGLDPDVDPRYQPIDIIDHLKACISTVERDQWRIVLPKQVVLVGDLCDLHKYGDNRVYLPYGNVDELTSFTYIDKNSETQTVSSGYTLNTMEPCFLWASNWNTVAPANTENPIAVTITYTTGYSSFSAIPSSTIQAIKVLAYHLFVNRGEESVDLPKAYAHLVNQDMIRNQRCMENC